MARLFKDHYRNLVRLAAVMVGRDSAEEMVQDAFARLFDEWPKLRDQTAAEAWLRSTVLNLCRSRLRRLAVARRHPESPSTGRAGRSPEERAVHEADHDVVIAALRRLPARQRACVACRFYLDLSEAETALTLGISAGSVKTHLFRAKRTLERLLEARP